MSFITNNTTLSDLEKMNFEKTPEKKENKNENEKKNVIQKFVNDNSNPHPILIAIIMGSFILFIWLYYMILIKPSMCGSWYDENGSSWIIKHNKIFGTVKFYKNDSYYGKGITYDNYINLNDEIGIWDYNDKIIFINGLVLYR